MSNLGKFKNHTPFIKEAGLTTTNKGETIDLSLRQDLFFKPKSTTPEHIKKFRKSTKGIPGVKQLHHGVFNDPKDHEKLIHGVKTKPSDHVDDCIKGQNLAGIHYFLNTIKEDKYTRNQREPLGKSLHRDYVFPSIVGKSDFKFGIPTFQSCNAKELLYSGRCMTESSDTKSLYSKTHFHSEPGEQKCRDYNWPVDKTSFIFGKPQPIEYDGAKKSLRTDKMESDFLMTKIVDKRLEDYRQASSQQLGKSIFKGTMRMNLPDDFCFGKKTQIVFNAASCLYGGYTERDMLPESDLGKSIFHRSKLKILKPKMQDIERSFGVPTIRNDLSKKVVSVSDKTNYGNEKDVFELLYPNHHSFKGLDSIDLESLLTLEEIKSILEKNNHIMKENDFEIIYKECIKRNPNDEGKVKFKEFVRICREFKREYNKYRNFLPKND